MTRPGYQQVRFYGMGIIAGLLVAAGGCSGEAGPIESADDVIAGAPISAVDPVQPVPVSNTHRMSNLREVFAPDVAALQAALAESTKSQ